MKDKINTSLVILALLLPISFLLSYPLMLLWNLCLVPAVTIVKEVGWLQMWGLCWLFGLLFKTSVGQKG